MYYWISVLLISLLLGLLSLYLGLSAYLTVPFIVILQWLLTKFLTSNNRNDEVKADLTVGDPVNDAGKQISRSSSAIAIGGASVSYFIDKIAKTFSELVTNAKEIAENLEILDSNNSTLNEEANEVLAQIEISEGATKQASEKLSELVMQQKDVVRQIENANKQLALLHERASAIGNITTTINQLADQTNMLALNAAIEAARAGDQGRGFAVVADEVRALAKKTSDATQGIDSVLKDINTFSRDSSEAMSLVADSTAKMANSADTVEQVMVSSTSSIEKATLAMANIRQMLTQHAKTNRAIGDNSLNLYQSTERMEADVKDVSTQVMALSNETENIFRMLESFATGDIHEDVRKIAQAASKAISLIFEEAMRENRISERDLFNFNYKKIEGTNPPKYNTSFDTFTDKVLPEIQEPILATYSFVIYAGAVDVNGYFPTHNKRFTQPLSGNYERDLLNNRTKRIFNDYTGSRCGKNQHSFLLQTYKRDTGEVMHDLSVPILVNGKHWGGFRIGYKAVQ